MRTRLTIPTHRRGLHDITDEVRRVVAESGVRDGACHLFLRHTSASLLIQENADPSARHDLEAWFDRIAPDGDPRYTHTAEGPDDMAAHIRAALTRSSETIPLADGALLLGTWQGVFLFEHRHAPHQRQVEVVVVAYA
jgi:secondary thiamine-phosphate synthase enzyme